ncbi:MAG: hypothetical protein U9N49_10985 [Campylobacterota bacterium]|nr:hypothetical protein [Campylobacterota bacterium]
MSCEIDIIIEEIILKSDHGRPLYKERRQKMYQDALRRDRIKLYREAIRVFKCIRSSRLKQSTIFDF